MKKKIGLLIVFILMCLQIVPVYAEENSSDEWYEMVEESYELEEMPSIEPYTLYIMNVKTSLAKLSSSKLGLRADVYCASTVQTVKVTFYLQKLSGSVWKNVSSGVATASNVVSTAKQMTVSGVTSGTYRAKTVTLVIGRDGYAETVTGYSGSITL